MQKYARNNSDRFLLLEIIAEDPIFAAKELEKQSVDKVSSVFSLCSANNICKVWKFFSPIVQDELLKSFPKNIIVKLFSSLAVEKIALAINRQTDKDKYIEYIAEGKAAEVQELLNYPAGSIGSIMDPNPVAVNVGLSVKTTISVLKKHNLTDKHMIFLVNDDMQLQGQISTNQLLFSSKEECVSNMRKDFNITLSPFDTIDEASKIFENTPSSVIPVIDINSKLVGVINSRKLINIIKDDALSEMQSMVGVSKDERALSSSVIAVKKRQLWLQINLLTAFLASSVVGLFEHVISAFTALAVLLPVAAGQSGNAGAQAMAVSMRGLSLREITFAQWFRLLFKELIAGIVNGVLVAISCGIGVYWWSKNIKLSMVLCFSLVISMTIAGISGALLPMILKKCGQDPAQSSSIILTTITDVTGFMSFLSIAYLLLY